MFAKVEAQLSMWGHHLFERQHAPNVTIDLTLEKWLPPQITYSSAGRTLTFIKHHKKPVHHQMGWLLMSRPVRTYLSELQRDKLSTYLETAGKVTIHITVTGYFNHCSPETLTTCIPIT